MVSVLDPHLSRRTMLWREALQDILSGDLGPMALAASPLQLTALGHATNASGLSPASARKLASWLRQSRDSESVIALCAQLLGPLPTFLSKRIPCSGKPSPRNGARCSVRPDDFEFVLGMWLEGELIVDMFGSFDYVKMLQATNSTYTEWRMGITPASESWETELDIFTDFLEGNLPSVSTLASPRVREFGPSFRIILGWRPQLVRTSSRP